MRLMSSLGCTPQLTTPKDSPVSCPVASRISMVVAGQFVAQKVEYPRGIIGIQAQVGVTY